MREQGMEEGYRVLSTILAGLLLYGGLGWVGDRVLHTGFLLPAGIVLGTVTSLYIVVKRHGQLSALGDTKSGPGPGEKETQ